MAITHLQNLRDKVLNRLEILPATRDSDITLMIAVWQKFYPDFVKDARVRLEDLYHLPNHESVKRIRALIQNDKDNPRYLPNTWEVAEKRGINRAVWERFINEEKERSKTGNQTTLFGDMPKQNTNNGMNFWR